MPEAAVRGSASRAARRTAVSLLAEEWAGHLLRLLAEAPVTSGEIERRLHGTLGRSPRRALSQLIRAGLVISMPGDTAPTPPRYALARPGEDLLEAITAIEAWWSSSVSVCTPRPGLRRLIAHREARLVGRALVEGPLAFSELQRRVPGLSAGTLHRLLSGMLEPGVVRINPRSTANRPLYELGEPGRRLGRVTVLSARWRWRWAPEQASIDAADIPGLVHLLAPLARAPRRLEGVCQLAVTPPAHWTETEPLVVWARVAGGRVAALALRPVLGVQARVRASPLSWCEALLDGGLDSVEIDGDVQLAGGLVTALADAIAR